MYQLIMLNVFQRLRLHQNYHRKMFLNHLLHHLLHHRNLKMNLHLLLLQDNPCILMLQLAAPVTLPNGSVVESEVGLFQLIYATTSGAVFASMLAYIAAQYCDVQLYHFWKRVTKGKHLWLRNNFSTLLSQLVDSVMVVTVTFGAAFLAGDIAIAALATLVGSNYAFKALCALADTLPLYLSVHWLRQYLQLSPGEYAIPQSPDAIAPTP